MKKIWLIFVLALLATACVQKEEPLLNREDGKPFRVAVAHTYDSMMTAYDEYDRALEHEFRSHGLNVELTHYYMDIAKVAYGPNPQCQKYRDSIAQGNFDLLITEGNSGFYPLLYEINNGAPADFPPIVGGGVNTPVWDVLYNSPHLKSIWLDEPDFQKICVMAAELSRRNHIQIELDYGFMEDQMRQRLHQQLSSPEFVDEIEREHYNALNEKERMKHYADRIVVSSVSLADPDSNIIKDRPGNEDGRSITRQEIYHCYKNAQVVLKRSMFSNDFSDKTNKPQFTVLPYDFGDDKIRYLAGYFVPMRDEARDVVSSAAAILKGETDGKRFVNHHVQHYIVDYNALGPWKLTPQDIPSSYKLINVPSEWQDMSRSINMQSIAVTLLGLIIAIISVSIYVSRRRRKEKELIHISTNFIDLLSKAAYSFTHNDSETTFSIRVWDNKQKTWRISIQNRRRLIESTHKDYAKECEKMIENFSIPGEHCHHLYNSLDEGKTYHHWLFRFVTVPSDKNSMDTTGIILSIDDEIERKERKQATEEHIQEMRKKEKFLSSMNHEIRTPLNSVLGFSQILYEEGYTDEERKLFCQMIKQNADQLLELMQEILDFNRIESGRAVPHLANGLVEEIMAGIYEQWRQKMEGHLVDDNGTDKTGLLHYIPLQGEPGLAIDVDNSFLRQAYSQFMKNAIMHTSKGNIISGWNKRLEENSVEIYVQDCGEGIASEQQPLIFRLFWKRNSMDRGVGLGLPIAKKIAEMMGGHVEVDSRLGHGTKISIVLPLVDINQEQEH